MAQVSGCLGLVDGWARRLHTHEPVHARAATPQRGPFYCPECHAEVALRHCTERADHFVHRAARGGNPHGGEGALHARCKEEICAALASRQPQGHWQAERPLRARAGIGEVRPDISGRVGGVPLAIEVQASALPVSALLQRTVNHAQRRIAVLWIVPRAEPMQPDAFQPALYERYLHSLYFGRTYYWWPGMGAQLRPIHYGHEAHYKTVKQPQAGRLVDIAADFRAVGRPAFAPGNDRKAVPACTVWLDRLQCWWQPQAA